MKHLHRRKRELGLGSRVEGFGFRAKRESTEGLVFRASEFGAVLKALRP